MEQVRNLTPNVQSTAIRNHVHAVLLRIKDLSRDKALQADCSGAIASLEPLQPSLRGVEVSGTRAVPRAFVSSASALDPRK